MKNKDRIGGIIFAIFGALVTSMASGIRMPANLRSEERGHADLRTGDGGYRKEQRG